MGVPPPPGFGDDCLICWAAGKTPDTVYMFLAEIEKCVWPVPPPISPPNGMWELPQILPCAWQSGGNGLALTYSVHVGFTSVQVRFNEWLWFNGRVEFACATAFSNTNICLPNFIIGEHGSAKVMWV